MLESCAAAADHPSGGVIPEHPIVIDQAVELLQALLDTLTEHHVHPGVGTAILVSVKAVHTDCHQMCMIICRP